MQIYADVTRMPLHLIGSEQGPALGSAMHAAVAAGVHPDIRAAAAAMGSARARRLRARRRARRRLRPAVRALPAAARPLRARRRRRHAPPARPAAAGARPWMSSTPSAARSVTLHGELPRNGLVAWTSGNVSARVPDEDLMVIKPSGVAVRRAHARADGRLRPRRRPRRRLAGSVERRRDARLRLPAARPTSAGSSHTHSAYATAWAIRGEPIPCVHDRDGGRVRRRDPGRAVRADRRRGDRPRDRRDARRAPLACGAHAQPRRLRARRRTARRRSRPR